MTNSEKTQFSPVIMYLSGSCPFCEAADALLRSFGVTNIEKIRVDESPERLLQMQAKTGGARTVPQIFIGGVHVGGYDSLKKLGRDAVIRMLASEPRE